MKFYGATRGKHIPRKYARLTAELIYRLGGEGISRQDVMPEGDDNVLIQWGGASTDALVAALVREQPFIILNAGYFDETRQKRFSVSVNGFHGRSMHVDAHWQKNRPHPTLEPWKRGTDGNVLILGQKPPVYEAHGLRHDQWLRRTAREAAQALARPALIRPHPSAKGPRMPLLSRVLEDASVVVTLSSNGAVAALIAGVPVVALDQTCPGWPVAMHKYTDDPYPSGREDWLKGLANREFGMYDKQELDDAAVYIAHVAPDAREHAAKGFGYVRGAGCKR